MVYKIMGLRRLLAVVAALAGVFPALAGAANDAWVKTKALAAPEAHQAAAADGRFVYAIANARIAKYDRATGERVAVSDGPAKHLNSGFLWQGRIYCAHSNYPRVPERSEIKVLDPASMKLTTFKDFGNFGGSLTWAVRHDGDWWCNFARYGDRNAETFLVRLDDAWKEKGRWTYPAEVLNKLGRYSLSGGVWRDGLLLVTGHDDPVLFRLRLPAEGAVLEYVDRQAVPFTGQGIAHDPRTGGLVGIDRANRQVVFADPPAGQPVRLRVLSYNIHHGEGTDRKLDLARLARVIESARPDLVALQEVDRNVRRSKGVDQPAELARLTGLRAVFGGNLALQGGDYGNAVLSRFPIRRHANHKLPRFDEGEPRGVLEVEVQVPGLDEPLLFLATHLDYRPKDRERLASARTINQLLAKHPGKPALLAGDLNDVPTSPTLAEFAKQWTNSNREERPTIPVEKPTRQIDYVLFHPAGRWRVIETRVLDEAVASDHRPILAVLELLSRRKSK